MKPNIGQDFLLRSMSHSPLTAMQLYNIIAWKTYKRSSRSRKTRMLSYGSMRTYLWTLEKTGLVKLGRDNHGYRTYALAY